MKNSTKIKIYMIIFFVLCSMIILSGNKGLSALGKIILPLGLIIGFIYYKNDPEIKSKKRTKRDRKF